MVGRCFSERFAAFVEDGEVGVVGIDAVAALAGEFAGDAVPDEQGHGFVGGGECHGGELAELGEAEEGALAQGGEHAEGVGGTVTRKLPIKEKNSLL